MPLTGPAPDALRLKRTQEALHGACLLCGSRNPAGFRLNFSILQDGGVAATAECPAHLQGYQGILHGGVTAALLDSAMANCLFARGISAVTAEMFLKYKAPVICGTPVTVTARLEKPYPPLYELAAEITQSGKIVALARAKFMESDFIPSLQTLPSNNDKI